MKDTINDMLKALTHRTSPVKILLAVESGSRMWGFASPNSDYDVRFIYVHRPEWYLALNKQRDVIEHTIEDLDMAGWDLAKALRLFWKGNTNMMEWLLTNWSYQKDDWFWERLVNLLPSYYNRKAAHYYYLHMTTGNYFDYLQGKDVVYKKYLYILRPLLTALWLFEHSIEYTYPPTNFMELVSETVEDAAVYEGISRLVDFKKKGHEMIRGPRLPVLHDFIWKVLKQVDHKSEAQPEPSWKPLDQLFLDTLEHAWE